MLISYAKGLFHKFVCNHHKGKILYLTKTFNVNAKADAKADTNAGVTTTTIPGPGCSKLTTLLVNEMLKFQMLITQICQYILLRKCECSAKASLIFSTKSVRIFGYKVLQYLGLFQKCSHPLPPPPPPGKALFFQPHCL